MPGRELRFWLPRYTVAGARVQGPERSKHSRYSVIDNKGFFHVPSFNKPLPSTSYVQALGCWDHMGDRDRQGPRPHASESRFTSALHHSPTAGFTRELPVDWGRNSGLSQSDHALYQSPRPSASETAPWSSKRSRSQGA